MQHIYLNKKIEILIQHPNGEPYHHREKILPRLNESIPEGSAGTELSLSIILGGVTSQATLITIYSPSEQLIERLSREIKPLIEETQHTIVKDNKRIDRPTKLFYDIRVVPR